MRFRQGEIKVSLIDHMGTDLTVVNAARVSFDKTSDWEWSPECVQPIEVLPGRDVKLIRYLAENKHWSPFAHTSIQFRIAAPIFVARQLVKHQVGLVWNEVSRRYVADEPVYFYPETFRALASKVKQGSSETDHIEILNWDSEYKPPMHDFYEETIKSSHMAYMAMIESNVAPEVARSVLPLSAFTEWYWTGSLYAFARICKERLDPHAQYETRLVAKHIATHCASLFPVSWKFLVP